MEYVVTNHIAYLNNGPIVKYLFLNIVIREVRGLNFHIITLS